MSDASTRSRPFAHIRRVVESGVLAALLAASFSIAVSTPVVVSAAGPTTIGTSSCTANSIGVFPCAQAYQRSAQDKVAYLHDGSLLVGFYDGHTGVLYHVTNPSTAPVSTQVLTFLGGEEESIYTLPGTGTTEIWVLQGNEIFGGTRQEQIQHGTYSASTFNWDGGNVNPVPVQVPGALTNGRQDPSVTWTGKWLIASWWDDTVGGNSDNVFYNWTTDRTGKTGWAVPMKSGSVGTDTSGGSTSISYSVVSGVAPAMGDWFQIGNAVSNDGTVTCVDMTPVPCNAELRQVTAVSGGGPYTLTTAAFNYHHFLGEPMRIAASLLTATHQNSIQVSIRHSDKLGATIAVYGAFCKVLTRTLLDSAADPSPANWIAESQIDVDDCDAVLNGPQIAIDENSGDIHVFKAMTSGEPSPTGIIYWHGVPDATFSTTGTINWSARLVIDPAASTWESDPPDIAGTVDPSTHRVYVFWVTKAIGGVVKYVTLDSPYTSASGETTMTTGTQPRYTHVPSLLVDPSTSKAAYVPLVYQTGTSCITPSCTSTFNIVLDTSLNILAPSVPAGLTATATSSTEVDLSWNASTDNVGVTGYTIYRNGVSLATVSGSLTYADKSVAEATTYNYTVDAFNAGGNHSAQSLPASATTPDVTPPSVPTGLSASATSTPQVNLSWSASTDNVGVTGYTIYRNGATLTTVSGSTLNYADKAVTDGTAFSYTIDAFDAAGNHSLQSAAASATTPDITPPSVPTGLNATATKTPEVDLSWNASTDNVGVTGYTIYRGGTNIATVSASTLTFVDKSVSDATTYSYTVDAFDAAGNRSAKSSPAGATTPDITPPSVPTGLRATATSTPSVILNWTASTDNVAVTGYTIYRNGSMIATVSGSTATYTDTNVVQAGSYSYTVNAFDAAGNHSAQSAPATVNTPDTSPPSVPTGLSAVATTKPSVTLTWSASTDNVGVTGYTIYRGGTKLTTVSASTLTYTDSTVAGLTTYSYTVDAFDAAGNHSAQSASANIKVPDSTPPSVPTGLTATFVASTPEVDLAWNASTDNVAVTGYTIYRNGTALATVSGSTLTYADSAIVVSAGYVYTVDAFDAAGNHSAQSGSAAVNPGVYTAMSPKRLLDTRSSGGKLGPGGSMNLAIAGTNGVPANASAVILNVTAVDESTAGFFTLYPTGAKLPTASNLNWVAGETVPNLVSVGLGAGGKVTIYNGLGMADAVIDLEGYFAPSSGGSAGQFVPVVPARITDTRASSGQPNHGLTLTAGTTLKVQVTGVGGIPASGVTAVVLNTTVTDTTTAGFLTVFPTGASVPLASNLNWMAGVTVPNRVIVPIGTGGQVSFFNGLGSADVIVDINGYFTDGSGTGASFVPLTPSRILDTRMGGSPLAGPGTMLVTVAGKGGVPASGAKAVVLNVTVVNPTTASALTVWPADASQPTSSDLNFTAGQTVPNLVVVKLSANGQIDIFNAFGTTNVIVDVVGWYG